MRPLVLFLATACGRIGFDPTSGDASVSDGTPRPWMLAQVVEIDDADQLAIRPTARGDLIVLAINVALNDSITAISDNAGSTFVAIPAARAEQVDGGPLELWYAEGVADGATTITVSTALAAVPVAIVAWTVSNLRPANALDAAAASTLQAANPNPLGPPITTSAPGAFVVSAVKARVVNGIRAGSAFTNDSLIRFDGYAHVTDSAAPAGTYQAEWDASPDPYCASAAAFLP